MKKRINLFSQRTSSRRISTYFTQIRIGALIAISVLGVILLGMGGVYWYFARTMSDLTNKKQTYERFITLNQSFNEDLQRFIFKYDVLKTYLADDAQSYEYYTQLQQVLRLTSAPKVVETFDIDNEQKVTITLRFAGYEDAIRFIEEVESTSFLDHFEDLTLNSFNAVSSEDGYSLQLTGTFTPQFNSPNET